MRRNTSLHRLIIELFNDTLRFAEFFLEYVSKPIGNFLPGVSSQILQEIFPTEIYRDVVRM